MLCKRHLLQENLILHRPTFEESFSILKFRKMLGGNVHFRYQLELHVHINWVYTLPTANKNCSSRIFQVSIIFDFIKGSLGNIGGIQPSKSMKFYTGFLLSLHTFVKKIFNVPLKFVYFKMEVLLSKLLKCLYQRKA